jgi:tryptophanyl-tRNA synthetase
MNTNAIFIADWHSLTTHADTSELSQITRRLVAELIGGGLDPKMYHLCSE